MGTCIVCEREAACEYCDGGRVECLVPADEGGEWVPGFASCGWCVGSGLSHTHSRKERKQARRTANFYFDRASPSAPIEAEFWSRTQWRYWRRRAQRKDPIAERLLVRTRSPWPEEAKRLGRVVVRGCHLTVIAHLRDRTMRDAFDAQDGAR